MTQETLLDLREYALSLPEAWEDFPWGDRVVKVKKKVFVFMGRFEDHPGPYGMSVKLPHSAADVLENPWAEPTGYGLGKAGWVSVTLGPDAPGLDTLKSWIEESYRAVAPKKLAAALDLGSFR